MRHLSAARWIAALSFLVVAACSGGSSAPPAYDLTGYWELYFTPNGSTETGPTPVFLSQTGSAIGGVSVSGSMSGTGFSITADGGSFQLNLSGTATSANSAAGTVTLTGSISGTGTFRIERFQPTGTMDTSGTLDGTAIGETSSTAVGMRSYSDQALTTLTAVTVVLASDTVDIELELSPGGLAVGALAVPGTVTADVLFRNDSTVVSATATSGTVTVTQYDAGGFAGSYSLTTSVGTITGSFAVSFDIECYAP